MRKFSMKKKAIAGVAVAALALGVGGAAFAYWTTNGSGTGTATTGTSTAVTIAQTSTVSALTPGGPSQALDFSITNPATTNQTVTSVTIAITGVTGANIDATHPCTSADFTLVQPTVSYGDLTPGTHAYAPSGASLALQNTASNQDGCKNASVALSYTAA